MLRVPDSFVQAVSDRLAELKNFYAAFEEVWVTHSHKFFEYEKNTVKSEVGSRLAARKASKKKKEQRLSAQKVLFPTHAVDPDDAAPFRR